MYKFAVIAFPGTNCETETVRAFKRVGMDAEIVRWNEKIATQNYAGYAIAGGFSFEDRGRSGVVAAQEPIIEILKKEADQGKIILGICNGAQVLVETGLVPGFDGAPVSIALTWNEMKKDGKIVDTGFYNTWINLKNSAPQGRNAFNDFDELLHIPIAHGEGRFMIEPALAEALEKNGQIAFKYSDENGNIDPNFPITPNGSTLSIAGLTNPEGNVMAIMPHPERDPRGNGLKIFESIKRWLDKKSHPAYKSLGAYKQDFKIEERPAYDAEVLVRLIITDNAERTLESAFHKKGIPVDLERFNYFGIHFEKGEDAKRGIEALMHSGELANLNKEQVFVRMGGKTYQYSKEGLTERDLNLGLTLVAREQKDMVGESKTAALKKHSPGVVRSIDSGVLWNLKKADEKLLEKALESQILYNPHSMWVTR
jgi:phosphoribosylformylglycinamidine synthase